MKSLHRFIKGVSEEAFIPDESGDRVGAKSYHFFP
jgi:hypothetical protein